MLADPERKPNILLITTDSQRWDSLACMGSPFAKSPGLDRLASEGVLFTEGYTTSPVCSPARCSLITGVHPPVHGCLENGMGRQTHLPVFTDELKRQGYRTIMVGKTHFEPIPESFDIVRRVTEKGLPARDEYASHIESHGFHRVSGYPNPVSHELFMDAYLADAAIEEMEAAVRLGAGPFMAHCSMVSPHAPIDPPEPWASLYADIELPGLNVARGEVQLQPAFVKLLLGLAESDHRITGDWHLDKPEQVKKLEHAYLGEDYSEQEWSRISAAIDRLRKLYYGLCAYCDHQVERLLDYLDRSGLRENTLVIFSSDHGQQYYNHGINDKHNFYDDTWRVPMMMSMPGTLPAGERRDFAMWHDLAPTMLAAAGGRCDTMQGFDLFTPLATGQELPRRCAASVLFHSMALVSPRWKLEYDPDEASGRLFDRLRDPMERNDLYGSPPHAQLRAALLEALLAWRAGMFDLAGQRAALQGAGRGPVARRVKSQIERMSGLDNERRLSETVVQIENQWNGLL